MTDKKLCGLRSVPSLFRLFANGVHCCPPKRRRDYKETALLFGRVASRLTWSVNARSRHCSACLGYSPPDRLAGVRPPFRSSARSARSFLRFTPKTKAVFSRKKSVRGERTFFPKMAYLVFCSASAPQKHNSQKSTLHNTQLCDIFYPSAFGYGKYHITCVMYKPLRLWLRGSTFLLRCSDQSTALQAFACSPLGRSDRPSFARATSAPTLRPPALWAFVLRFPASARPPLPAFDLRRGRLRGD